MKDFGNDIPGAKSQGIKQLMAFTFQFDSINEKLNKNKFTFQFDWVVLIESIKG